MEDGEFQEMCHALVDLAVSCGLMGAVMDRYPEEVQENFKERMNNIAARARDDTAELQEFAQAFDDADAQ